MSLIEELYKTAKENNAFIYDICVYEDGKISSKTVNFSHRVNNVYSVSKTFTASAVGILCDRGLVSLSDNIFDILGKKVEDCPEVWKKVTLKTLLSQKTGLGGMFLDVDCENIEDYGSDDFLDLALKKPMDFEPNIKFGYSDSNFYIASRVVSEISGDTLQEFLRKEIFAPMGFQAPSFAVCPKGYAMGGTGLSINCLDMLKFGIMLLNGGLYKDRYYLSKEWISESAQRHSRLDSGSDYGLGLWLPKDCEARVLSGMYGQEVFIDDKNSRVAAWQAFDREGKTASLERLLEKYAK